MTDTTDKKPTCGVVMPISATDGCSEAHWGDVREIIFESIEAAGFDPNLVSDADDVGVIQKRIIQNIYENPIVVCDVSGKNPNVMLELGLRLAFDKPVIIVKDDQTPYSFDTSPIEHLGYPRDLRFNQIVDFKNKLADKIRKTHEKANSDPSYTPFLKHFGEFTVAKIDKKEVPGQDYIIEELHSLRRAVEKLSYRRTGSHQPQVEIADFVLGNLPKGAYAKLSRLLANDFFLYRMQLLDEGDHEEIRFVVTNPMYFDNLAKSLSDMYPGALIKNSSRKLVRADMRSFDSDLSESKGEV